MLYVIKLALLKTKAIKQIHVLLIVNTPMGKLGQRTKKRPYFCVFIAYFCFLNGLLRNIQIILDNKTRSAYYPDGKLAFLKSTRFENVWWRHNSAPKMTNFAFFKSLNASYWSQSPLWILKLFERLISVLSFPQLKIHYLKFLCNITIARQKRHIYLSFLSHKSSNI